MLLERVVAISEAVAATRKRIAKYDLLAELISDLESDEIEIGIGFLTGVVRQGNIGVGYATLRKEVAPATEPSLTLHDVDAALTAISGTGGPGSQAERRRLLDGLFGRATEDEQDFLVRLVLGDLRQGASEGVMIEALARAAHIPAPTVRRAVLLRGDLRAVAAMALTQGEGALAGVGLEVLRPLLPMLAKTSENVAAALDSFSPATIEWKIDGARIQVHRQVGEVRIFTRNLADITDRLPEVVDVLLDLDVESIVLDGEVVALQDDGRPHPFQVTMSRFGAKTGAADLAGVLPLTPFFFDCLHLDGRDLLDLPGSERSAALEEAVPENLRVPHELVEDATAARMFFEDALERGHEGVMIKNPAGRYEAGRRGSGWLKVKPVHTFDLVVLAVEWGSGRRHGWLSNLHLGARSPRTGDFVMLGKTFKGLTDQMLEWQTKRFLELETHREGHVVFVRPEQVVEVAFDGIQASSRYPGGMALRFARVKAYRNDKTAEEADTIETVRSFFRQSSG